MSIWDLDSLNFLLNYDTPWIKIPSAMLTNDKLIKASVKSGRKIILSTGMSTEEEVDHAVKLLDGADFALLHCSSAYPAPLDELNMSAIKTLKEKFDCEVGYSGHEFRLMTSIAAIFLGATIIERHVTLDRTMWGSDQLSSVEPHGLFKMVSGIRVLEVTHGDGKIKVTKSEIPIRKKLRNSD